MWKRSQGARTRGLELLQTLPDTGARAQHELLFQTTLGVALIATRGYAAPEVGAAYRRARDLCQQLGETPHLFPVLGNGGKLTVAVEYPLRAR